MSNFLPQGQRLYMEHTGQLAGAPNLIAPQAMRNAGGMLSQISLKDITPLISEVSKAYTQRQTELIDAKYLEVENEFRAWQAEYVKANRGGLGLTAARDFEAKHREMSEQAVRDYLEDHSAGDENFGRALAERFDQKNLEILGHGIRYQREQEQAYKENQFQGQLELFDRYVEENAANWDGIKSEARNLLASWQLKNPGLDPAALAMKLEQSVAKKRVDVLIAQEKYDEAEAALNTGQIFAGAGYNQTGGNNPAGGAGQAVHGERTASGQNRDPALYKGGQINEDLNNPLNLKKPGANGSGRENYQVFETPEDGFRGAWQNLKKYKAKGIVTPRAIISRWAPPGENRTEDYIRFVAKQTGLDPDKAIDIDDTRVAGLLIKVMGDREGRLATRFTPEQVTQALEENGGKPRHAQADSIKPETGNVSQGAAQNNARPQSQAAYETNPQDSGMPAHIRALAMQRINAARMQKRQAQTNNMSEVIEDFICASERGEIADVPYGRAVIENSFGEKAQGIWARMQTASRFAYDMKSLALLRPEEQAQLLERRKPVPGEPDYKIKARAYDNLARAVSQDNKMRAEDPALYVVTHNEPVRRKAQVFLEQRNPQAFYDYVAELKAAGQVLGSMEGDLLPKNIATQFAKELEALDNPAAYLMQLEKSTGAHWEAVRRQIFRNASPLLNIACNGMDEETARLLLATRRQPDFRKKAIAVTGEDEKVAKDRIFNYLEDLTRTLNESGAVSQASELQEAALDLALQYRLQGKSMKEACKRAACDVGADKYEFEKSPDGSLYRIPRTEDAEKVFYGAAEYLRRISPDDLLIEDMPKGADPKAWKEDVLERLAMNARFITDGSEAGLFIKIGPIVLRSKDGRPLNPKWDELTKLSQGTTPDELPGDIDY